MYLFSVEKRKFGSHYVSVTTLEEIYLTDVEDGSTPMVRGQINQRKIKRKKHGCVERKKWLRVNNFPLVISVNFFPFVGVVKTLV